MQAIHAMPPIVIEPRKNPQVEKSAHSDTNLVHKTVLASKKESGHLRARPMGMPMRGRRGMPSAPRQYSNLEPLSFIAYDSLRQLTFSIP
jgi:hypothetical protein